MQQNLKKCPSYLSVHHHPSSSSSLSETSTGFSSVSTLQIGSPKLSSKGIKTKELAPFSPISPSSSSSYISLSLISDNDSLADTDFYLSIAKQNACQSDIMNKEIFRITKILKDLEEEVNQRKNQLQLLKRRKRDVNESLHSVNKKLKYE